MVLPQSCLLTQTRRGLRSQSPAQRVGPRVTHGTRRNNRKVVFIARHGCAISQRARIARPDAQIVMWFLSQSCLLTQTRREQRPQSETHIQENSRRSAAGPQRIGNTVLSKIVIAKAAIPKIAKSGVHVRNVSFSVRPPILAKIQKPESFIHEPTRLPQPTARAR